MGVVQIISRTHSCMSTSTDHITCLTPPPSMLHHNQGVAHVPALVLPCSTIHLDPGCSPTSSTAGQQHCHARWPTVTAGGRKPWLKKAADKSAGCAGPCVAQHTASHATAGAFSSSISSQSCSSCVGGEALVKESPKGVSTNSQRRQHRPCSVMFIM